MSYHKRPLAWFAVTMLLIGRLAAEDELRFRNGAVLRGKAVEMDSKIVVFRTGEGLKSFSRADVSALFLDVGGKAVPGLPPGITFGAGWQAKRWVTFNKITAFGEDPQQRKDVNVMNLSADGSRIGLLTQQGAFTLDAQGGNLTQLSARDTHGHLDFSADGKVVAQGTTEEVKKSEDPFVKQFIGGLPDGPVPFHYKQNAYTADLDLPA